MRLNKNYLIILGLLIVFCLVLYPSAARVLASENNQVELVYDDGKIQVFAQATPMESAELIEPQAAAPKVKVLATYTGDDPMNIDIAYPWFGTGQDVYHYIRFEILKRSDLINVKFAIGGPEPWKAKTGWVGPYDPGWLITFWIIDTFVQDGLYSLVE